jgi:exodeoxyribonuclease-3
MKLATYNVNGINGRLPVLLRWLEKSEPVVACLQELKTSDEKFPADAIEKAGYGAIWHGQKSWNGVAILARGRQPEETRRGLPGDPDDTHSRYIETKIDGILIGCLYLPNGNPAPGPKFDYKLKWLDRLATYAKELVRLKEPVILAGDYNVIPTELDAYKPERWVDDALFFPESRAFYQQLLAQGWTDALRKLHPDKAIYTFWDYFRNAYARNAGIRIDHFLLNAPAAGILVAADVERDVRGWEKTSDHAPTWIELAEKTRERNLQRLRNKKEASMAKKKKKAAKRELVDTGRDKRYVRRDSDGKFEESDDMGQSLSQDRKKKAKRKAKAGQGDKGDRKKGR